MCFILQPLLPNISICWKTCFHLKAALIDFRSQGGWEIAKYADRNTARTYNHLLKSFMASFLANSHLFTHPADTEQHYN